jgi:DNA gyrase subunit A
MTTKDEDDIMNIRYAQTHDNLLFFTNKGKVYQIKAYEIAESSRTSKGSAIVNLLNIEAGERVESFINYAGKLKDTYVFLTTRNGTVKKSKVSEFENIRRSGIVAIKLDKGDELVWSTLTSDDDEVLLVTKEGKAIRFNEKQVRPMGRATQGVRGIKIGSTDEVISMDIVHHADKDAVLLTVMENGLGKKTLASEFRGQTRGGMGVKVANVTDKTGKVVVSQILPTTSQNVIITSKKGQVVQLELKSIPRLSRATQGVILMRFSKAGDHVASATCVE